MYQKYFFSLVEKWNLIFSMELNLSEYVRAKDPKRFPVSIQLTEARRLQWDRLNAALKHIRRDAHIADFARDALYQMLDQLEAEVARQLEGRSAG